MSNPLAKLRYTARSMKARLSAIPYRFMPVEAAFARIYDKGLWGHSAGGYTSGSGSQSEVASDYVAYVRTLIAEAGIKRVLDVGCGDFRVSRAIIDGLDVSYVGVDVVPGLIRHNSEQYGNAQVQFRALDAIEDDLPGADLCLVRQVLQHLSNDQIHRVLARVRTYRYGLVTEHVPSNPGASPNKDKTHGPDIRLYKGSGVFIEAPPFSVPSTVVVSTDCAFNGKAAVIRTSLVRGE